MRIRVVGAGSIGDLIRIDGNDDSARHVEDNRYPPGEPDDAVYALVTRRGNPMATGSAMTHNPPP